MKRAFTLAETLITLIIISIIAALTLPVLRQKYINRVVENKLKKFYFAVNQAIDLSEIQYGDKKLWYDSTSTVDYEYDEDGNRISATANSEYKTQLETWCNKYLIPYLKVTRTEFYDDKYFTIYLADGSVFMATANTSRDWYFIPSGNIDKCLNENGVYLFGNGKCAFSFIFYPISNDDTWVYHYNKGMEPFKHTWDGDTDSLYSDSDYGCTSSNHHFCTAIIQMNGWKIPDDYPYKVEY